MNYAFWYSCTTTLRKHRAGRGRRHITCILFKPQLCRGPVTGVKELPVDLSDRCETEGLRLYFELAIASFAQGTCMTFE